jgi:HEAT repeat protein
VSESPVVERQRQEIERLKAEVAALKASPAGAKAPDKSALAAEIFELFLRSKRREAAPEDKMEMIKRIGQLEPSMAAIFIEKYRTATDPEVRETAFLLTVLSGGPDASRFAAELLNDQSVDVPTRRQLKRSLAGLDDMPIRCTAEESLTRIGVEWVRSAQGDERAAAAGILGMGGSAEGVVLLRGLAETDASDNVRAAAVVGLAKIGDADVLAYLKAMEMRADLSDYLKRYLKTAIGSLERRLAK